MLTEALTGLAAAGGTAVVQAVGTDLWTGFRQGLARWFGRGDNSRERAILEGLDRTAAALEAAEAAAPGEAEQVRSDQEASWRDLFHDLLEELEGSERANAAGQLRILLDRYSAAIRAGSTGGVSADALEIHAERGSIAAGVIHGDVSIANPPVPDPNQG